MKWLKNLFAGDKNDSAQLAKDRLKVIVAHAKSTNSTPDFLPKLQQEIMQVIAKYVKVDNDKVSVSFEKSDDCSVLELNMTLPEMVKKAANEAKVKKKRKKKAG
jgi:cell division topological specificity factor